MNIPFENTEHRDRHEHTVLIIDDEPANLRVMSDYLASFGLEALVARDGETGIEKARYAQPDLILLDVLMPGMDGFETCRRLKADETLRDVPVIFVTALTNIEDKVKGFQLGGVDYITKPFQQDEVLARVTTHLRLRDLTESLERQVRDRTQELLTTNQQLRYTNQELTREVGERRRAEEALHKINQAYKALSQCNQALVRATEAKELLQEVCRIIVEDCGYHLVWIGFAEHDEAKSVRPVTQVGYEEGYLDTVNITWADTESGRDPTGTAIRTGQPVVRRDILTNPDHAPWQAEALERGYASSAVLPLITGEGDVIGVLNVFSVQPDAFATEEIVLLTELANDLAYGLVSLRARAERGQMEQALRESEELHRITIENILDPVFLTDDNGRFIFICPNVLHILGYTVAEIQAMGNISKLVGEDLFSLDELKAEKEIHNVERVIVDKHGRERDFLTTVRWVSIKGGTVLYTCHDITERKRAEAALRASEQRYHSLFEDTPLALWEEEYSQVKVYLDNLRASGITDLRGYFDNHPEAAADCAGLVRVLDVNKAAVTLVGARDKEDLLAGLPQGFTTTSLQAFGEQLVTLAEGGLGFESEATYRKLTGEEQVVLLHLSVAPGYEHSFGRVLVSMLDITERKRAEEAYRASVSRFGELFNKAAVPLCFTSKAGETLHFNAHFEKAFGYSPEEVSTLDEWWQLAYPDPVYREWVLDTCYAAMEQALDTESDIEPIEYHITCKNGDVRTMVVYGGFIGDELLLTFFDITERKQAEESLRQSEYRKTILNQIANVFLAVPDEEMYAEVLSIILQALPSPVGFWGYIGETGDLIVPSLTGAIGNECQTPDKSFVFPLDTWGESLWGKAIRERRTFFSNGPFRMLEGHMPIEHCLMVPVVFGQETIGLISAANKAEGYTEADRELLEYIAAYVAPILQARLHRDVQERDRKRAERELQQSNDLLQAIIEAAPTAIIGLDLDGHVQTVWNPAAEKMLGWSAQEAMGRFLPSVPQDKQEEFQEFRERIRTGQTLNGVEVQQQRRDGTLIDHSIYASPLHDVEGRIVGNVAVLVDITERKRAEEALRESEERYRSLFEGIPVGIYRATPMGQLLDANPALVQMLGYPDRESLLAEDVTNLYVQDEIRVQWKALMEREGVVHGFELQGRQRDGTIIWIRDTARAVRDANDQVLYFEGSAEDITEHKRTEEALRESEERYRTFVQNFQGIAFRGQLDFTPIFFHGAVEKITGYTEGEFLAGKPRWDQVIHPDDLTTTQESGGKIQSIPNQAIEREYRIVRKEGYTRWVHEFIQNVCDASGKLAFVQGALYDVTERKQAEEALARRANQLILINELGTKITAMLDLDQVLTTAARLVQKNFGYHHVAIFTVEPSQGVVMRARSGSYATLFPDEYQLEWGRGMVGWAAQHGEKLLANDVAFEPRYISIRPDLIPTRSELSVPIRIGQDIIGVLDAQSPEYNAFDENDVMVMETVADQIAVAIEDSRLYEAIQRELDERKRAEEKIRQQNEFLENVLASLTHPFYVVNTSDYTIEMANTAAMLDGLAAGRATCYAHTHHREVPCDGIEYLCPLEEVKRTKQPVTVEHVHQDRDGNRTHVEVHGYPILDKNGNVVQVIKYILDITERRHAEKMLLQSERLAAMGRLAASVAHEINNPLQSVQGCLALADEELAGGQRQEKMARYLRIANGEIERIADIVRRMRDFYRPTVKGMQPTDIHTLLQSVLELANKQLQHSSVIVERRWAAELPRIEANADHLKQVFLNLVLNAMDAMPDGGTLQVQTALDQLPTRSGEAPQPAVRIEFSDTGQGMSPEHQIRLFEPFFTTKEQGSGLGLYISHGIVTAHHGQISVVSYEGLGSTFSIILPVAQP